MSRFFKAFVSLLLSAALIFPAAYGEENREPLVSNESVWHYNDERVTPFKNEDWIKTDFDCSDWKTGSGSFGEKNGRLEEVGSENIPNKLLREKKDGEKIPVYYFRLYFDMQGAPDKDALKYVTRYDDSVIIYLNGTKVYSGNVPEGGFDENGRGAEAALGGPNTDWFTVSPELFKTGRNVFAAELHQHGPDSSDAYFCMESLTESSVSQDDIRNATVFLSPGSDESEINVSWQGMGSEGWVELTQFCGTANKNDKMIFPAQKFYYSSGEGVGTFRAALKNLEAGKKYIYRVVDEKPSNIFSFTTPENGDFSFIVNGDPQIDDENDAGTIDVYDEMIIKAAGETNPAFILTLGDQVDAASNANLYLRFISNNSSNTFPMAAIVGNHDRGSDNFSRFFSLPNVDEKTVYKAGDMSGDFWFKRGSTLFLGINSNNYDFKAHAEFIDGAKKSFVKAYGEPKWIIAAMHHSLYSVGEHAEDEGILKKREAFTPMFEKAGVDVVFAGHDHIYARTRPIGGVVYFTLGSPTGTKYYDVSNKKYDYANFASQSGKPCATRVDVTENALTVTTYARNDDLSLSVIDKYEKKK